MTTEEWIAEREKIRSSPCGEHRKSLYPLSEEGGRRWREHFDWLTMNLPGQWIRYKGNDPYRSTEAPKPGDDDFEDAKQVSINHEMIMEEAGRRGLLR